MLYVGTGNSMASPRSRNAWHNTWIASSTPLVSSTSSGVNAQRLSDDLPPHCRAPDTASDPQP